MERKKDEDINFKIASPGKPEVKSLWKATLAGGITGTIEASIMYPTEFIKTQLQLQKHKFSGPLDCISKTYREHGPLGFYRGLSSLIIGSAPKVGVRFGFAEQAKNFLRDQNGKLSASSNMLAGLYGGAAEAIFVVTPMETIKTKFIHDLNHPIEQRKYRGFVHGVSTIIKEEGIGGVYKGLLPTLIKQSSNQGVRFLVYDESKKFLERDSKVPIGILLSLCCGALAGGASVLVNNPIDVIKTKMQGLDSKLYSSSFDCAKKVFMENGPLFFYRGVTPRLVRVCGDSAITFTVYSKIVTFINSFDKK